MTGLFSAGVMPRGSDTAGGAYSAPQRDRIPYVDWGGRFAAENRHQRGRKR